MTLHSLQALTWGTVTGAVVSALLLASGESAWPELARWRNASRPIVQSPRPAPQQPPRKEAPQAGTSARQPPTTPASPP